jgi:hypothetical protein
VGERKGKGMMIEEAKMKTMGNEYKNIEGRRWKYLAILLNVQWSLYFKVWKQ